MREQKLYSLTTKALLKYRDTFGDVKVPRMFVVPDDDSWGDKIRGLKLGPNLYHIANNRVYAEYYPDLEELGIKIEAWHKQNIDIELIHQSLLIYRRIFNHSDIVTTFVIPATEEWPEDLHGFEFGKELSKVHNSRKLQETKLALQKEGYTLIIEEETTTAGGDAEEDANEIEESRKKRKRTHFQDTIQGTQIYQELYKTSLLPQHFIVPAADPWPKHLHGMKT